MASQDVIELGSSDDEPEPAPKKCKRPLNAMVHIPMNLPGITIKPTKPSKVTKVTSGNKPNFMSCQPAVGAPLLPYPIKRSKNQNGQTLPKVIKPLSLTVGSKILKNQMSPLGICPVRKPSHNLNKPIRFIQRPAVVMKQTTTGVNLPPGITVTRKRLNPVSASLTKNPDPMKFKKIFLKKQQPMSTVEIEDDETSELASSSPQWYVRPEDQPNASIEKNNSQEPEMPKFVEITIEDSPVKPHTDKRLQGVEKEIAITIDDSPVKPTSTKTDKVASRDNANSNSDEEQPTLKKTPNSKKKLKYSEENQLASTQMIEIEVEPMEVEKDPIATNDNLDENSCNVIEAEFIPKVDSNNINKEKPVITQAVDEDDDIIEISESPVKKKKHKHNSPIKPIASKERETEKNTEGTNEFHPVYQQFIDLCFELENSDDMQQIVERKVKSYYRQVPKDFTESEEFIEMVSSKIESMKAGPEKMFTYIKDIVDELNIRRKMFKGIPDIEEGSEQDVRRRRQIRKLEKTLKKLQRTIHKLEDQEVDFDDDGDSVYILTERYKERLLRVHAKLCQLSNVRMPSEPYVHIEARPGQPTGPVKRLEKWINRKVPLGAPIPFPDYHDVLRCVKEANTQDRLLWSEAEIQHEALDLFTRCGKKLQRRRQENEWRIAASRIAAETDPAETSLDLKRKLEENKKVASQREADVIKKFAERQNQLKLEGEEIGDNEAEESPDESDDEGTNEAADDVAIDRKEDRKETLKRPINKKSSKENVEKDNNSTENVPKPCVDQENEKNVKETSSLDSQNKSVVVGFSETEIRNIERYLNQILETDSESEKTGKTNDKNKEGSVSDDSKKVDSDMDELHLLQKLPSGPEVSFSNIESSDNESLIAISDTLSSEEKGKTSSGVVSIEDSTSSDCEEEEINEENGEDHDMPTEDVEKLKDNGVEESNVEEENVDKRNISTNSNDECPGPVEDILLESSEEDSNAAPEANQYSQDRNECLKDNKEFVNLKDDSISIGDTVVEGEKLSSSPNQQDVIGSSKSKSSDDIPENANENTLSVEFVSGKYLPEQKNTVPLDKETLDETEQNITSEKASAKEIKTGTETTEG